MDTDYYFDYGNNNGHTLEENNDLSSSLTPEQLDHANFVLVFEQTPYPLRLLISAMVPVGLVINLAVISLCCRRRKQQQQQLNKGLVNKDIEEEIGSTCCSPFVLGSALMAFCNFITLTGFLIAVSFPSNLFLLLNIFSNIWTLINFFLNSHRFLKMATNLFFNHHNKYTCIPSI